MKSNHHRLFRQTLLAALLIVATTLPTQAADDPAASKPDAHAIPADLAEQVKRSETIGRILFVLDWAGAEGTDVMRANTTEEERSHLAGYLPFPDENDGSTQPTETTYFFTNDNPARVAYTVTVGYQLKPVFKRYDPTSLPSLGLSRLFEARQSAMKALSPPQQPLNPIALPAAMFGEEGTVVYALAGTTKPNVAVFGKHYRVLVAPDGTTITSITPMTKGIMEIPTRPPEGKEPVAVGITQLLTDYPTETQVCTNRIIGIPVAVITKRGLWQIDKGHISFVSTAEEMEAASKRAEQKPAGKPENP